MITLKSLRLPAAALALSSALALPVAAAPLSTTVGAGDGTNVVKAQYWRYGRYHHGGYWRNGRWIAPLVGGAIIGGAIAASRDRGYYAGGGSDSAYERCAERFRSFDPATGTYTSYSGETVVCPYLR